MASNFSEAFKTTLTATGFLTPGGRPVSGLTLLAESDIGERKYMALASKRAGLNADAFFSAQGVVTSIFKDCGQQSPQSEDIHAWHEAAWNVGAAPLLWLITPSDVRLFDCYAPARKHGAADRPLDVFRLSSADDVRRLNLNCGRFVTESGGFWDSEVGKRIDRRYRVDRELLAEISALEAELVDIPAGRPESFGDLTSAQQVAASREFAQRLIGRCIFVLYLIERGIAQRFLPESLGRDALTLFSNRASAFRLFEWLRETFNGDLFPMDDPGAERDRLTEAHLQPIREFISGVSLVPETRGQGRLFRFRFDAIPVELISSIYQQFARSSAAEEARVQGLHYTPAELVHMTLEPVFEGLSPDARIIDPTCGSGAFLVEAFRRLIAKKATRGRITRREIRETLAKQLFGVDINRSALGIAAFSLYLAALELDEEPVSAASDLRFDRLIGSSLFHADARQLPLAIAAHAFDVVVGNPPWTYAKESRAQSAGRLVRPRRSPDQDFLAVAVRLAGGRGRIGMLLKASPFFSVDEGAIESRKQFLADLDSVVLVNLSALRKEQLFPGSTGPALLLLARCPVSQLKGSVIVGSLPWSPEFSRTGYLHVGLAQFRRISLKSLADTPSLLKAAAFGSPRAMWLIEKLEKTCITLDGLLTRLGISKTSRGQGFQVQGDKRAVPEAYYSMPVLTPDEYSPFRIDTQALDRFDLAHLHRPREITIYAGPVLICPKASFKNAAEAGRYSAAISDQTLLYTENFYGISFAGLSNNLLSRLICGILNSSMASFQLALAKGSWGLERPTVEPGDLLSLRLPDLSRAELDQCEAVVQAEAECAQTDGSMSALSRLDREVCRLYGLTDEEQIVVQDSVAISRGLIFDGHSQRRHTIMPPTVAQLDTYARAVLRVINSYLRARGRRHLVARVFDYRLEGDSRHGRLAVVKFAIRPGPAHDLFVERGGESELAVLSEALRGPVRDELTSSLNERRSLRIYFGNELYVTKPAEIRNWTEAAGLNDADVILADHWSTRDVEVAH